MTDPTSPNSPDRSVEAESSALEAPDMSHTDAEPTTEQPPFWNEQDTQDLVTARTNSSAELTAEAAGAPVGSAPVGSAPTAVARPTERARPTGPHLPAILLGLACLVVAIIAIAQELGRLTIDWGNVGPLGIVAAGAVLVVLGLVGLMASRKN